MQSSEPEDGAPRPAAAPQQPTTEGTSPAGPESATHPETAGQQPPPAAPASASAPGSATHNTLVDGQTATAPPLAVATDRAPVPVSADIRARRWRLVRDLLVFQAKILVDGLKDLVLGPVALVAGAIDLLSKSEKPGENFYTVMQWGRDFDHWVDLFGERRHRAALTDGRSETPAPEAEPDPDSPPLGSDGMDAYLSRFERVVLNQYKKGGITAKAKDAIDKAIDAVQDGTDLRR